MEPRMPGWIVGVGDSGVACVSEWRSHVKQWLKVKVQDCFFISSFALFLVTCYRWPLWNSLLFLSRFHDHAVWVLEWPIVQAKHIWDWYGKCHKDHTGWNQMQGPVPWGMFLHCVDGELENWIERIASAEDSELAQKGSLFCPQTICAKQLGLVEGVEHSWKVYQREECERYCHKIPRVSDCPPIDCVHECLHSCEEHDPEDANCIDCLLPIISLRTSDLSFDVLYRDSNLVHHCNLEESDGDGQEPDGRFSNV